MVHHHALHLPVCIVRHGMMLLVSSCNTSYSHTYGLCEVRIISHNVSSNVTASLRFNSHFPGGPGLASTRMSPFWIFLELRVMEVVVTTGAIRRAKLQKNCHHQHTNIQFLQVGCPSLQCFDTVDEIMCSVGHTYLIHSVNQRQHIGHLRQSRCRTGGHQVGATCRRHLSTSSGRVPVHHRLQRRRSSAR